MGIIKRVLEKDIGRVAISANDSSCKYVVKVLSRSNKSGECRVMHLEGSLGSGVLSCFKIVNGTSAMRWKEDIQNKKKQKKSIAKRKKLENILSLKPQCSAVEYGKEPSLYELIEKYYEPHFPTKYKDMAKDYVEQLTKLVMNNEVVNFKIGDEVAVILDTDKGNPDSIASLGVCLGDRGVITSISEERKIPIGVTFESGTFCFFYRNELEVVKSA